MTEAGVVLRILSLLLGIAILNIDAAELENSDLNSVDVGKSASKSGVFEDKSVITEIELGNANSDNKIEIYISPSCLHCAKFVIDDVDSFLSRYGDNYAVVLKFLPTTAKDIFIMKLIQNESKGDKVSYLSIYKKFMKRALATINHIEPTEKQKALYKGSSTDAEMIKFQVNASNFGFSDKKIQDAFPDQEMSAPFERTVMLAYSRGAKEISEIIHSKELDLPLVINDGKSYKTLNEAVK